LYAKWKINQYTVTYNGNGNKGGSVPLPVKNYYNTLITAANNVGNPTLVDISAHSYKFLGWNTKPDGKGIGYTAGPCTLELKTDIIFYAHWEIYYLRDKVPAGGFVFYDKGNYANGWRYLEAAPGESEWINKLWGVYGKFVGTKTNIGSGKQNTPAIVSMALSEGDTVEAALLCDNLNWGGYDDWFLPSKDELQLMYSNLKVFDVGKLAGPYWSSSEISSDFAWGFEMDNGVFTSGEMTNKLNVSLRVRAVRAF